MKKAMILAAGLGTRLRPWTLSHPKALVPVGGVPMLERVILRLKDCGFDYIVVNTHHFASQIKDFLQSNDYGVTVKISDESDELLDTGGGIAAAMPLLGVDETPFLVHNVDILSDAPLDLLMRRHEESGMDVTLLTSDRESSRKLIFDSGNHLVGWHNLKDDVYRPEGFGPRETGVGNDAIKEHAFSGIYVMDMKALKAMSKYGNDRELRKFPIMDWFLELPKSETIGAFNLPEIKLIDIGKPDTLRKADSLF